MNKNSIVFGAYCGVCCMLGVIIGKMEKKYECKVAYAMGKRDFCKEKLDELKALKAKSEES